MNDSVPDEQTIHKLFGLDETLLQCEDLDDLIRRAREELVKTFGFQLIKWQRVSFKEQKLRDLTTRRTRKLSQKELDSYRSAQLSGEMFVPNGSNYISWLYEHSSYSYFIETSDCSERVRLFREYILRISKSFGRQVYTKRLEEHQTQLKLSQRIAKIATWEFDPINRIFSPSRGFLSIFDLSEGEVCFRQLKSRVHSEDLYLFENMFEGARHKANQDSHILRIKNRSGEYLKIVFRCEKKYNDLGIEIKRIGIAQDITLQEESISKIETLESELIQAQKLESIGLFTRGIVHDFNNVLASIQTNTEVTLDDVSDIEHENKEYIVSQLQAIQYSTTYGIQIIKKLLMFTRRDKPQLSIIDVNQVVDEMEKLFRFLLPRKIRLFTFSVPGLWHIYLDKSQLEQILLNLVINGKDAIRHSGDMTIATKNTLIDDEFIAKINYYNRYIYDAASISRGPYVQLSVSDTGSGIPVEDHPRIFQPFFTTKPPSKGTGMGLSIIQRIVEKAGGYIFFDTEIDAGTTFRIYLPAYQPAPRSH